jgi:RimJ/RimL family protein N-acetyltransferase
MASPILIDFPDAFHTERLLIRGPRPGDGAEVYQAVEESLAILEPWMPWAREPRSPEQAEENIRASIARFVERTDLRLNLYDRESSAFVGGSGLHRIDWDVPRFEIGFWCRVRFQGRGLITEAVRGIAGFAFEALKAKRVEVRCAESNLKSRAVIERVGFSLEGILRNYGRDPRGELRDTLLFSMLPAEYQALSAAGSPFYYCLPMGSVAE